MEIAFLPLGTVAQHPLIAHNCENDFYLFYKLLKLAENSDWIPLSFHLSMLINPVPSGSLYILYASCFSLVGGSVSYWTKMPPAGKFIPVTASWVLSIGK